LVFPFERACQCSCTSLPWGKNEFIVDKAFNDLKHYDGNKLLYLMAGIPDVTNKLEEKNAANKIIDPIYSHPEEGDLGHLAPGHNHPRILSNWFFPVHF
jgi:hypothetical protein